MLKSKLIISILISMMFYVLFGTASAETIKVGAPLSYSGAFAGLGVAYWRGLELAVSDLNDEGGILGKKIEIIKFDVEELSPEKVMQAADQLIGVEKVDSIYAGWAGWGQDVKAYGKYDVPTFHCDGSSLSSKVFSQDPKRNSNVFQMYPTERDQAINNFDIMASLPFEFPNNKVAIIVADDDWGVQSGNAFKERAKDTNWDVVMFEVVPYGTREWGSLLTKIRSLKPAIIYLEIVSAPEVITFFNQFMENPTNSLVNLGYAVNSPDFEKNVGKEMEGILSYAQTHVGAPNFAIDLTKYNSWVTRFKDKYKSNPTTDSFRTYADVINWARAVEKIGNEKEHKAISEYILKNPHIEINGWTPTFDEDNTVRVTDEYPMTLLQYQNEEVTPIYVGAGKKYGKNEFKKPRWTIK